MTGISALETGRTLRLAQAAIVACLPARRRRQAQSWPSRPVKVIMATGAGSAPDVIARIVTDRLAQFWGQQVLILNRPGAGGLIALQALAASERDGHTLYLPSSSSLVVLPETNPDPPLDIQRDLVPVGLVGEQPFTIVAGNSIGVNTLPELIALAKKKPGELTYAANFRGSLPNMTGEWFRDRAGIEMTFVPYPSAPMGLQDVMGGRISAMVEGLAVFVGAMASNSIKPLGSPRRSGCRTIRTCRRSPKPCPASTRAVGSHFWAGRHAGRRRAEDQCRPAQGARPAGGPAAVRDADDLHPPSVAGGNREFIRDEQAAWRPVVKQVGVVTPYPAQEKGRLRGAPFAWN